MTETELTEIEEKAAQLRGIVFHLDVPVSAELEEFAIQTRPNILRLCAALREAWELVGMMEEEEEAMNADADSLRARIAELEGSMVRWANAQMGNNDAEKGEAATRIFREAGECAAKRKGI